MAIVFAADCHLRDRTFSSCVTEGGDPFRGFIQTLETAKKYEELLQEPISVVLGGDVWDIKRVHPQHLSDVKRVVEHYGVPIYHVSGNHDVITPAWLDLIPGTIHLRPDKSTVLPGGETVVGIDYCTPKKIKEMLDFTEKGNDFLVVHQFVEVTEDSFIGASVPLSAFKDFKVVLAGDIHRQFAINNRTTELYYPGPTCRCAVTEPAGGCMVISRKPLPGGSGMLNGYYAVRVNFDMRPVLTREYRDTFDVSCVLDFSLQYSGNWSPFLCLKAPTFDADAISLMRERWEASSKEDPKKFHLLFRHTAGDETHYTCSESADPILATNAMEYSIEALKTVEGIPGPVKELSLSLLSNEDAFFEEMREKLLPE